MNYFEFWVPILKKQYFKFKLMGDIKAIVELEDNIWRNWKLSEEDKRKVLKEIKGNEGKI